MKSNVLNELKEFSELQHFVPLKEAKLEYDEIIKKMHLADEERKLALLANLNQFVIMIKKPVKAQRLILLRI